MFTLSDTSKDFLLTEGTDLKYGARHLKRAIERLLVQPISNLIATDQVRGGDWIRVDFDPEVKMPELLARSRGPAGSGYGPPGGYFGNLPGHDLLAGRHRRAGADANGSQFEALLGS